MTAYKRKLIEVALPLEAINREAAREKSIRHGHPSTLHQWWARRPLAACRAVLFAQLVDDPASRPDEFPDEESQTKERKRLFDLIERLVKWENSNDEKILKEAREEIWKSCDGAPPPILDPFAGGGSIPLEAQRLGLEAHASDLNPVAVLINKALIEIPPKWTGQPPVFPGAADELLGDWAGATGLAEDVRRYGQLMRDEAEKRIGHLYPKVILPDGSKAAVIAWIWARTVKCPNPACGIQMPLVRSWWLGKKKGKEAYVVPSVINGTLQFSIGRDTSNAPAKDNDGTIRRTGAICVGCGSSAALPYIRTEGKAGRISRQLIAIAAKGKRRRVYLPPNAEHIGAADVEMPEDLPLTEIPHNPRYLTAPNYGMTFHVDLFTNRQLTLLVALTELVSEISEQVKVDAHAAGMTSSDRCDEYSSAIGTYLAFCVCKIADNSSTLCGWMPQPSKEGIAHTFARQAIPMVWDFGEANPMFQGPTCPATAATWISKLITNLPRTNIPGTVSQAPAQTSPVDGFLVCTDPPYYDNVGYADLSDFFYIWLRKSLGCSYKDLFCTVLTPKEEELVADPFRQGSAVEAGTFFRDGFEGVFKLLRTRAPENYPMTVFYAFKQAEVEDSVQAPTGWETLLDGMLRAGWSVTATWPMRTERGGRMRDVNSNALASSIVLACQPRHGDAGVIDRRGFIAALRSELPMALRELQQGSIAPVDLPQAAIGPGMAIFSRYARVAESDGAEMQVGKALTLINQVLAEILLEQEGDFDSDTRWCVKWFERYGYDEGRYGEAETLASAYNVSIAGLSRAGVLSARAGKVTLFAPDELPDNYDPAADERLTMWEVALHLAQRLDEKGIGTAAIFMQAVEQRVDLDNVKELIYLLFSICEKRGWSRSALLFNALGTSWSDLLNEARYSLAERSPDLVLEFEDED